MKRKKGFTLIELLAVIVILAIIALIAVPVVMNIIDKANKSAFKNSAYGIIKAGELYYSEQEMSLNGIEEDKVFTFPNDIEGLKINGSKPTGGSMIINENGKIAIGITNGKWCVIKDYNSEDIIINNDIDNCYNPAAPKVLTQLVTKETANSCMKKGEKCNNGIEFALKVNDNQIYNFYVIEDTGDEITLIMNNNLGPLVEWISDGDYEKAGGVVEGWYGNTNKGPLTALNALKERTNDWINITERNYEIVNDDDGKGGENTYPKIVIESRARMLTYTEFNKLKNNNGGTTPKYLYINLDNDDTTELQARYWLSTADSMYSDMAWIFRYSGKVVSYYGSGNRVNYPGCGIRPVITLSK